MQILLGLWRSHSIVCLLSVLFLIEVVSIVSTNVSEPMLRSNPIRISEITGPRIDGAAAFTIVEGKTRVPEEVWWFLVLAYVALIIFNFSSTFERVVTPQWFWEVLYTLCVICGWVILDPLGKEKWFPFMIIKSGLILFVLYVYLLEKKLVERNTAKTERLLGSKEV